MPAHNPDFKGEKMKKKVAKKGTPRAKRPSGRRKAPPKKPRKVMVRGKVGHRMVVKKRLRLKVGKTYVNRIGLERGPLVENVKWSYVIETHKFRCPRNAETFMQSGRYLSDKKESPLDLIREVPPPKSPNGRGK